ncbi:DUF2007 domain-containing protein [Kushneria phosphatilytica]|uniref:DUF2007 domain-containing protein n=1 Tax=Kushneria phosphatilytica TaxID=657387 RepID=A0A1S1NUB0_9GAMM|nr:DUF2007 domain-containing protein [Kushneria phosphatilytica]OHV10916.1 hypothetical protein BH688_08490 [Kushneria phosphatilytica]QEL11998.1 DUF2007 domain-containing protein [Kushneria phosphatilytica]
MAAFVRLFCHPDSLLIGHLHNLLENAGIPCELRNWSLAGGAGELPPLECEPELWVAPHNLERAEALISRGFEPDGPEIDWCCPHCGERHAGHFDRCWQCGSERPAIFQAHL